MTKLTKEEIRKALEGEGIEVTVKCDYTPSGDWERAAYQAIEFTERAWRDLLLAATNRAKMSRQLCETQRVIVRKRGKSETRDLCVRVLTVEGAVSLQDAGYALDAITSASLMKSTTFD